MVESCTTVNQKARVKKTKKEYYDPATRASASRLKRLLGADVFADCVKKSRDECMKEASIRSSKDDALGECVVCLGERKANYYLIHGGTAHKCVCPVCAMKLALSPGTEAKCPVCREIVWLFLESAPLALPCVCNQASCKRYLVVKKIGERSNSYCASLECSTCTLEATVERHCCMTFELF